MLYPSTVTTTYRGRDPGAHRWRDFVSLPHNDSRELIDGHLVQVEVPTELHEWIVAYLTTRLMNWALEHGGRVLTSGYKVRVSDTRGVMPDVQFYRSGRPRNPPQGLEKGAPDLAVEVISPSSRAIDRVRKRDWYASIGTPEYWLVDPEAQTVERFLLAGGVATIAQAAEFGADFEPASFPGLVIDLERVFTIPE